MTELGATLRQEMTGLGARLRQEMSDMGATLRQEMANGRFELLKWSFVFWVGQVLTVTALVGLMLRLSRP
jgi:hypothetical protein